jgi:hypothetical protein
MRRNDRSKRQEIRNDTKVLTTTLLRSLRSYLARKARRGHQIIFLLEGNRRAGLSTMLTMTFHRLVRSARTSMLLIFAAYHQQPSESQPIKCENTRRSLATINDEDHVRFLSESMQIPALPLDALYEVHAAIEVSHWLRTTTTVLSGGGGGISSIRRAATRRPVGAHVPPSSKLMDLHWGR